MLNISMIVGKKKYLIFLVVLLCVLGVAIFLVRRYLPSSPLQKVFQKKPVVAVKTTYKNPFDKKTQYVNPFEKHKNPFVTNR